MGIQKMLSLRTKHQGPASDNKGNDENDLAANIDGVGKEGVCVGMVDVLLARQAADKVVSVTTIVVSALDLGQVGHLVDVGISLILSVAISGEVRQVREVEVAHDHVALAGERVG